MQSVVETNDTNKGISWQSLVSWRGHISYILRFGLLNIAPIQRKTFRIHYTYAGKNPVPTTIYE